MMNEFVDFKTSIGTIRAEIDSGRQSVTRGSGNTNNIFERSSDMLEESMGLLRFFSEIVARDINKLNVKPSKVELKFGIKLTAEAGAIIAKTSAEGNLEVNIVWDESK